MGRKKMMQVESTPVESTPVESTPVFQFETETKRYSVTLTNGEESKVVLPELSKTQDETVNVGDYEYVVAYNEDENKWIGSGITISPAKGQGAREPFEGGPFDVWYPNGYVVGKHRTLQRVDFKDPWNYRLFRVRALLEFERARAKKDYDEKLKSVEADFAEDVRVVNELSSLTPEERNTRLTAVVKAAKKAAAEKAVVNTLVSGGAEHLASLLSQCALSDEDKAKLKESLAAALAAM